MPRSPLFDAQMLLDVGSLSPETLSVIQGTTHIGLPRYTLQATNAQRSPHDTVSRVEPRNGLQLKPSSSILGAPSGLSQWEPGASPAAVFSGIPLSDPEQNHETASDAEPAARSQLQAARAEDKEISFDFEPNTLERRASLFYDSLDSEATE